MKTYLTLIGTLLILLGIIGFSYQYFTYTTNEKILEIGDVKVTAKQENQIYISPILSGLSFVAGVVFVLVAVSRKV